MHAKAWLFHRNSGFSTAYVGSSNLTQMAQVDGLEWNVRASAARNPDVVDKVRAVFESYWQDDDFVDCDAAEFATRLKGERRGDGITLPPTDLHALPFQSRLLEQIALARARGHHRNLLVAATGTGKTVMAALDYASQIDGGHRPTLLFVAHRRELLSQALATFRHALRDPAFGELWVGGAVPVRFDHVFASIQTLRAETLERLAPTRFQVVIIDEFNHAAADSWVRLLDHMEPAELLGLTATPERADGISVLDRFDGRIAAELRLWDAIDQQRLVPFAYFGVADGTDPRQVPWRRGRGNGRCWSDLREAGGLDVPVAGLAEVPLRRAIGRLLHVDDDRRLRRWRDWLAAPVAVDIQRLPIRERRLLRMLVTGVVDQAVDKRATLDDGWSLIVAHDRVRSELLELLDVLGTRRTHVDLALAARPDIPLRVHARYTRREILAACGVGDNAKVAAWQTGVYRVEGSDADLLAFTLDKTEGGFSPTTRYRDYAISRTLVHWESQNSTREDSETGVRYRRHAEHGGAVLLFARERADDRAFWFLGPASYVSHEGERPMAITWRLEHALPADLYAEFAAAVA